MSGEPKFSVVIPTYNRLEFLKQALSSVWAQTFTNYEIIVVDDGSNDGTMQYLQSLEQRVKGVCQPNQGPGAARNRGVREARCDYVAFLDSDDLWFPWTLEIYCEVIEKHQHPSFVAGKPHCFWDERALDEVVPESTQAQAFSDYLASGDQWRWWGASSFVIRSDAFIAVNGFTEERINGEDADLALRLGVTPGFIQITAPATFGYREHAASTMKDLRRTVAGAWANIRSEQKGRYPGGLARAFERRRILTRHTRPVALNCLQEGLHREAWGLYLSSFAWNVWLGRIRYLAGFPALAVATEMRRTLTSKTRRRS